MDSFSGDNWKSKEGDSDISSNISSVSKSSDRTPPPKPKFGQKVEMRIEREEEEAEDSPPLRAPPQHKPSKAGKPRRIKNAKKRRFKEDSSQESSSEPSSPSQQQDEEEERSGSPQVQSPSKHRGSRKRRSP